MARPASPLACLALTCLLLAGCAHAPPATPTTAGMGTSGPAATAPTPASATASAAPAPVAKPAAQPVDIQLDGQLAASACIPAGPDACTGTGPVGDDHSALEAGPAGARTWSGNLTLTWDATTPAMKTLDLLVQPVKSCGATCRQGAGPAQRVEGTSPLTLAVANLTVPADGVGVQVNVRTPLQVQQSPLVAGAQAPQAFTLRGTLWATPV